MLNEPDRRAVLPWFLGSLAVHASLLGGEIYAMDTIDGAALWIWLDRKLFGSLCIGYECKTRGTGIPAVKDRCHSIPRQRPLLTALEHQPPSRYPTDVK
jgi:hypothetical protein